MDRQSLALEVATEKRRFRVPVRNDQAVRARFAEPGQVTDEHAAWILGAVGGAPRHRSRVYGRNTELAQTRGHVRSIHSRTGFVARCELVAKPARRRLFDRHVPVGRSLAQNAAQTASRGRHGRVGIQRVHLFVKRFRLPFYTMDPSRRFGTVDISDQLVHRDRVVLDRNGVLHAKKIVADDIELAEEAVERRFPARIGEVYYALLRLFRGACNYAANGGWILGGLANSATEDMAAVVASVDTNVSAERATALHAHQTDVSGPGSLAIGAGIDLTAANAVVVRAGLPEPRLMVDEPDTCWIAAPRGTFFQAPPTPIDPPPGFLTFFETEDGQLRIRFRNRAGDLTDFSPGSENGSI